MNGHFGVEYGYCARTKSYFCAECAPFIIEFHCCGTFQSVKDREKVKANCAAGGCSRAVYECFNCDTPDNCSMCGYHLCEWHRSEDEWDLCKLINSNQSFCAECIKFCCGGQRPQSSFY